MGFCHGPPHSKCLHPKMPAQYQDWWYVDLPKLSNDLYDKFIEITGENNLKILTYAEYKEGNTVIFKRGQFYVSPKGRALQLEYATPKEAK